MSEEEQHKAEATEKQAKNEGAFNEETGEINWDCPVSSLFIFSVEVCVAESIATSSNIPLRVMAQSFPRG